MQIIKTRLIKNNYMILENTLDECIIKVDVKIGSIKEEVEAKKGISKVVVLAEGCALEDENRIVLKADLELEVNYLILTDNKYDKDINIFSKELLDRLGDEILEPLNYNLIKGGFSEVTLK